MGIILDMITRSTSAPISLKNPPEWFQKMLGGGATASGQTVTETSALSLSPIYSCIDIRSKTMATLPIHYFERMHPRGKNRAFGDNLYHLMHDQPNGEQTAFAWKKLMSIHQLLWGAAISEIEFDINGNPVALWPIPPWRVTPKRLDSDNSLYYEINLDTEIKILFPHQVFCVCTMSVDGYNWLSPIGVHRETIGIEMAARDYGAKTYGGGINPAGILSGVRLGKESTEKTVREKYSTPYTGLNSGNRLMVLEDGVKFERIGIPPVDAQYLESRRFNVSEFARIYGVPLYMLADHEKQTSWGTGIEEQKDGYITFTIVPDCTQWEQELNLKLVRDYDYFYEFTLSAMLRGTFTSRVDGYIKLFQNGFISIDDGREMENMNPLKDGMGDINMVPMNLQNVEFAKERPVKSGTTNIQK